VDAHDSPVVRVGGSSDETILFEAVDDRAHRRRAHLLGRRELADSPGAAEHEHGQGGETGRAQAAGLVLASRVAKRVDRSGVEPICSS
jgi:hypothetical protein